MKTVIGAMFLASNLVFSHAWADDAAGSNIALSEYPGPTCTKPQKKPFLPVPPEVAKNKGSYTSSRVARQETIPADAAGLSHNGTPDAELPAFNNNDERSYNDTVEKYNKDLRAYNANMVQFNSCIKTYMDNGNADLMRVQQKLNAIAADANAH